MQRDQSWELSFSNLLQFLLTEGGELLPSLVGDDLCLQNFVLFAKLAWMVDDFASLMCHGTLGCKMRVVNGRI